MAVNNREEAEINLELTLSYTSASPPPEPTIGFFLCMCCDCKFYSSQALGGHQNAHKLERSQAKRRREAIAAEIRAHHSLRQAGAAANDNDGYGGRAGYDYDPIPAAQKVRAAKVQQGAASAPEFGGFARGESSPEYGVEHAHGLDLSLRL